MTLAELQQMLTTADPAAVLVSARVLDRVIQEVCQLQGLAWTVPHRHCFVVDRHVLFRHVEQDDLILQSHQLLPPTVILLVRPGAEELTGDELAPTLRKYWRLLFHANVHHVLQERWEQGLLSAESIRQRLGQIGPAECDEIRSVLRTDQLLRRDADDREVYIEFAATFLEQRLFLPELLAVSFPAIRDLTSVERLLCQDLDATALYERTRLGEPPQPGPTPQDSSLELHEYFWKLTRSAERAAKSGNRVKAAIIRTRAARVAPAALTPTTRAAAEADLKQLTQRLQEPLQLDDNQAEELLGDLKKLLDKADQGRMPVEAALLNDLQQVCLDHEREIYALDIIEWALSLGKRPIQRPLPTQRMVHIIRHVRSALQRLTISRLTDADRKHLNDLLNTALQHAEQRLRQRVRPVLIASMEDVGLTPSNPPEQTAFHKMVEEFLDRIIDAGFVTFGDLRDTISRNQLKMPDLSSPQEFIRGDPLLRLDRRLATLLDGVYRPSEIYMRWLERATALSFGTKLGRLFSHLLLIPFGAAFVCIESLHFLSKKVHGPSVDVGSVVAWGVEGSILDPDPWNVSLVSLWALLSLVFLGCFYSETIRGSCRRLAKASLRGLKAFFIDLPIQVLTMPGLQRLLASWPVQLLYWYAIKPGLVCFAIWVIYPYPFQNLVGAISIFVAINIVINSHTGMALSESLMQGTVDLFHMIRSGLLVNLFNFVVNLFKDITHFVEYLLFSVDEWLRFRKGDSEFSLFVRALVSTIWFPIAFILRFYWIVLIEPIVNPIKLPICIVAGKLFIPFYLPVQEEMAEVLTPVLGVPGYWFAWVTVYLLPDLCGFLIWEFKENWSLYRANRSTHVKPVRIGHHGETLRGLMQAGFHSGTIPGLFDRLRRAERASARLGNWRAIRSYRQTLEVVKVALKKFVTREMISLVHQSASWSGRPLQVGEVLLATNRVEVELMHTQFPGQSLWLQIESRADWLVGQIRVPGWLRSVAQEPYWVFAAGLAYLFKVAGIDLVQEQVQSALPPRTAGYDVGPRGLLVWPDAQRQQWVRYDFAPVNGKLVARGPEGNLAPDWPSLPARSVIFARNRLTWKQLVRAWQTDATSSDEYRIVAAALAITNTEFVSAEPAPSHTTNGELHADSVNSVRTAESSTT